MVVARAVALVVVGLHGLAMAEPRTEVGGYAGPTSTTIYQTFSCPPSQSDCVTGAEPHNGGRGLSLGAYVRYAAFRVLQIETNVLYVQKGYGGQNPVRMHYLEVPLLVRLDPLARTAAIRPFAYAGAAPAILVACHEKGLRFDNATQQAVPYSDACGSWMFEPHAPKRFDIGGVVGAGIGWESPWGFIELQARYVEGLIDNAAWGGGKTVNKAFYVVAGFGRLLATSPR